MEGPRMGCAFVCKGSDPGLFPAFQVGGAVSTLAEGAEVQEEAEPIREPSVTTEVWRWRQWR